MATENASGETVIVPWDGTPASRAALEEGGRLAAGGRMVLVHAQGTRHRTVATAAALRDRLSASVRAARRADLEVRVILANGDPLRAVLDAIERESATLAVIGTRGESRFAARSLSVALLRAARIPVVITRVRPRKDHDGFSRPRVIVGVDFSPASREAAAAGARLAHRRGAALTLLHVLAPFSQEEPAALRKELERLARTLDVPYVERSCFVLSGTPADALIDEAEGDPEAWIVVGTRNRGALRREVAGSVAEEVLRRAPGPVVVARAPVRRAALCLAFDPPPFP